MQNMQKIQRLKITYNQIKLHICERMKTDECCLRSPFNQRARDSSSRERTKKDTLRRYKKRPACLFVLSKGLPGG